MNIKAVFLDRDGIINELVYYPEHGIVDSPFTVSQFRLTDFAIQAINKLHYLGYKVIVISNQPGIAKGHFDESTFDLMRVRMRELLSEGNARIDYEYYCLHHPNGSRETYRMVCECRKPRPGLIIRAAKEHNIGLSESFLIGDGLVDVRAGNEAGCTTILVASMNSILARLMEEQHAGPDYVVRTLEEAVEVVEKLADSASDNSGQSMMNG